MRRSVQQDERAILGVLCFAAFLTANGIGSINIALPTIQHEFGVSLAAVQWISIMGGLMISTLALCWGRVGDLLGRRSLYRFGIVLYTVGSGLCAFAPSFVPLLISRMIMTAGLAMVVPLAAAIIASTFPANRRGRALGLFVGASAAGRAAGPTLGGLVAYVWDWRAIFLTNLLLGAVVCVAVFIILSAQDERKKVPFDIVGTIALVIGYPALLIGFSFGASSQWQSPLIPVWFGIFAVALVVFLVTESRVKEPLIRLSFFKSVPFSAAVLAAALAQFIHNPVPIFAPLYMTNVLSLSALVVGLVMTTLPLSIAIVSPISGRLSDSFDTRYIATAGLCIALIGTLLYSRLGPEASVPLIVLTLALLGVGLGMFTPANQTAAFAAVDREYYGVVAAMLTSFGTASGYLGVGITIAFVEGVQGVSAQGDPLAFAAAQQIAFTFLAPVALLAVLVCVVGRSAKVPAPSPT